MPLARDRDGRRPPAAGLLLLALGCVVGLGVGTCSSGGSHPPADATSEIPVAGDAPLESASVVFTCEDIRTCAAACADTTCLDGCRARGYAAAQATFADLMSCLGTLDQRSPPGDDCTGVDPGCYCREECNPDGYCLDQVAACLQAASGVGADTVCNGTCLP